MKTRVASFEGKNELVLGILHIPNHLRSLNEKTLPDASCSCRLSRAPVRTNCGVLRHHLAQQLVREIAEVKGGMTPAEWLPAHTAEKLQMFNGAQYANNTQRWCARTVVAHPGTTGRAWTRSVYFYDPQPPADDALPEPGTSSREVLETTCQLGLMWIDIPEANQAVGTKLTEDVQVALVSQYGSGSIPRFGPGGFGSAGWTGTRQWNRDGAVLTVAYDQFRGKSHRVLVRLAFANSDAIHDLIQETEQTRIHLIAERDELVRKVKEAGIPTAATAEMSALLEKPDYFSGETGQAIGNSWQPCATGSRPQNRNQRPSRR